MRTHSVVGRIVGLASLAALLCGCPAKDGAAAAPTQGQNLVLGVGQSGDVAREGPALVGSSAALRVSLPQGAATGQLFGALLVSEPARLTEWHAAPAEAARFDGNKVVFTRTGSVEVWATWTDAQGHQLESNKLAFQVGGDGPSGK